MANPENQPDRLTSPATLATLVLIGVLILLALWLRSGVLGSDRWPIVWLEVEGQLDRTSISQVRAAAAKEAERGFFALDLGQIRSDVEALPWVARASVSRRWPDALYIQAVEHRPVARWNDDRLLSDRGEVFTVTGADAMQGLARLEGPETRRQEVLETWLRMRESLAAVGTDISRLRLDERGAWTLEVNRGIEVMLGRERVDERLARFVAVFDALLRSDRQAARIDMRYTNGLAVRWAGDDDSGSERRG